MGVGPPRQEGSQVNGLRPTGAAWRRYAPYSNAYIYIIRFYVYTHNIYVHKSIYLHKIRTAMRNHMYIYTQ